MLRSVTYELLLREIFLYAWNNRANGARESCFFRSCVFTLHLHSVVYRFKLITQPSNLTDFLRGEKKELYKLLIVGFSWITIILETEKVFVVFFLFSFQQISVNQQTTIELESSMRYFVKIYCVVAKYQEWVQQKQDFCIFFFVTINFSINSTLIATVILINSGYVSSLPSSLSLSLFLKWKSFFVRSKFEFKKIFIHTLLFIRLGHWIQYATHVGHTEEKTFCIFHTKKNCFFYYIKIRKINCERMEIFQNRSLSFSLFNRLEQLSVVWCVCVRFLYVHVVFTIRSNDMLIGKQQRHIRKKKINLHVVCPNCDWCVPISKRVKRITQLWKIKKETKKNI